MKQFLPDAVKAVILTATLLSVVILAGCPEAEQMIKPVTEPVETTPPTTVGAIKGEEPTITEVAEEPDATTDTTSPKVTKVAYYADWQLTKPITDTVEPGMTIYTKVVFSRQMQHVVSDEDDARPILSFLIKKEGAEKGILTRYKIAGHDAGGEDFVSGDAKPLQSGTEDYVCKYVVPKEMVGTFGLFVGAQNADTEGTILGEVYHGKKLVLKQAIPADTVAPTVVSITHYHSGNPLEEGDMVTEGSVIRTEVLFSEPVEVLPRRGHTARPVLTYTTRGVTEQFTVALHRNISFGHCRPSRNNTLFTCKMRVGGDYTVSVGTDNADVAGNRLAEEVSAPILTVIPIPIEPAMVGEDITPGGDVIAVLPGAPETGTVAIPGTQDFSGFVYAPKPVKGGTRAGAEPVVGVTVAITSGPRAGESVVTDQGGRYIFPNIEEDEIYLLVEKRGFEPKEVIVHRSHPTRMSNGVRPNFHGDPQQTPGNVLIGHSWPSEVQFILRKTSTVYDLLYVDGGTPPYDTGGFYNSGTVVVYADYVSGFHGRSGVLGTIAHEIAHAHQHALTGIDGSGNIWGWKNTPEGQAFAEARRKDWEQVGKARYDNTPGYDTLDENAAETCAHYWSVDRWGGRTAYGNLRVTAPNRFKWAEEWLR